MISDIISEPDQGIYDAMNKGLRIARGNYVLFLNSADRFYERTTLEKVFSMDRADIYYGETAFYDNSDKFLGFRSKITTRKLPPKLTHLNFLMGMPVSHQSFIVRSGISGEFNTLFSCSADIDWCIRALKKSNNTINTGNIISKYLIGGHSHKNRKKCWLERFKILKQHFGLIQALVYQFFIALRFIFKYILLKKKY